MMQTEIITGDDIKRYLGLVDPTEISGMEDGRFTLIGCCLDDPAGKAVGILSAEVLGPTINIKRVFVLPEYRRKGVARALLKTVTDLPEEAQLPIIAYGVKEDLNIRFLSAMGFRENEREFTCIEGRLGDFKKLPMPEDDEGYSVLPAEMATEEMIQDFTLKVGMETGAGFSDLLLREDPFSDGSIVCLKDGSIVALIILDEIDRKIEVPLIYGNDPKALLYCFAGLHEELTEEYGPDAKVRFILYKEMGREAIMKIMGNAVEKELYIFEYGKGGK